MLPRRSDEARSIEIQALPHGMFRPLRAPMSAESVKAPLVSVYIPTRDRPELLKAALASVLNQSHRRIEVIVVNDGGEAGAEALVESFRSDLEPGQSLVYLYNPSSCGAPAARNQAIFSAKGDFITGLDDDDEFLPDRIEYFLQHASRDFSFLSTCVIERANNSRMSVHQPLQVIDSQRIRRKNFVGNQVFVRTDRVREIGGFDETLKAWQDYDLWLRLIDRFGPALKLPHCTYLLDRCNSVSRITTSDQAQQGFNQFLAKHGESMTPLQRKHQTINDLHNRSVRIGAREFCQLFERETAVRLLALVFKAYRPGLYRSLVQLHMRLAGHDKKS